MHPRVTRLPPWLVDLLLAVGCAAVVLALVLAAGGIWESPRGRDLHGYFLPRYEAAGRALLHEHRLPLWNPYEFCGSPLLGVIQTAALYPPIPLLFGTLSPFAALQALYAFHFVVLGWGTLAYLRGFGVPRAFGCLAFFVTVAGVFTGASQGGVDHPNFLGSMVWIPALLICFDGAVRRDVRPWLGLFALAYAVQWLVGYPDFPLDTAVLLGVVALLRGEGSLVRRGALLAAGLALGVALVGFQMVPAWEAISESARIVRRADFEHLRSGFAAAVGPEFTTDLVGRYGVAVVALAVAALWRAQRVQGVWLAALLWCIFALDWPLRLLYRLPPFDGVRFPYGWSHIAPLFMGFLVASGAARLAASVRAPLRLATLVLALAAAATSLATIARIDLHDPAAPDREAIAARARRLADLREAAGGADVRVVSALEAANGAMLRHRLPSITGYDPSSPVWRTARLLNEIAARPNAAPEAHVPVENRPDLAALLGVGLVTVPRHWVPQMEKAGYRLVAELAPNAVVVHRPPVPRARLVHRVILAQDDDAAFAATVDSDRDARATVVLEAARSPLELAEPPVSAEESVEIVRDLPERVEVEAMVAAPALLVLTDTFYPGWEVAVDGVPAPLLRADYAFRAVALEPGRHRVVFRFAPRSLRIGALVSALALLVTAALLVTPRRPADSRGG